MRQVTGAALVAAVAVIGTWRAINHGSASAAPSALVIHTRPLPTLAIVHTASSITLPPASARAIVVVVHTRPGLGSALLSDKQLLALTGPSAALVMRANGNKHLIWVAAK